MRSDKTLVVDIFLKDGTFLRHAVIFPTGERGEYAIQDKDRIYNKMMLYDKKSFSNDVYVVFQTEMINGKFHPANVVWFEMKVVGGDQNE